MKLRKPHRAILRDLLTIPPDDSLDTAEFIRRTTQAVGKRRAAKVSYKLMQAALIEVYQGGTAGTEFRLSRTGRMMAVWLPPEPTGWAWLVDAIFGLEAAEFF